MEHLLVYQKLKQSGNGNNLFNLLFILNQKTLDFKLRLDLIEDRLMDMKRKDE